MRCNAIYLTLVILLLLVIPLTIAQDITITPTDITGGSSNETESTENETRVLLSGVSSKLGDKKEFPSDPKEGGREVLTAAQQAATEALRNPASSPPVKDLLLPSVFVRPTAIVFNIKDQSVITLTMFVVLVSLFIGLFVLLSELVDVFSERPILRVIISLILTSMAAFFGTIGRFAIVLTSLSSETLLGQTINLVLIIIGIIVAVVVSIFIKDIIKGMKDSSRLERAERGGVRMGSMIRVARRRYRNARRVS